MCRHCVVDPPQPAGHEVSQQHVNTSESKYEVKIQCNARQYRPVVPSSRHKGTDADETDKKGEPVKEEEAAGRVLLDGEVAHGESHGVPGEDVVATVDVLPVDGESPTRQQSDNTPILIVRKICH